MAKRKTARKTAKRSPTRKTPAAGKKRAGAPGAAPAIQGWPTDPMGGVPPPEAPYTVGLSRCDVVTADSVMV